MSSDNDGESTSTPTRRVMPKRIERLTLPAPYDDFHVLVWINFSAPIKADLQSGDEARTQRAFSQVILDHDLVDFDGEPLPPTSDPGFVASVPNEILEVIGATIRGQVGKLPPTPAAR